jgi:hypothetical protein
MSKGVQNILRWIAVLPGSIAAGILSTFFLHFTLYSIITNFVTPYPESPERILTPFFVALTFIWTGGEIAPSNKLKVGVGLFSIWIFIAGGLIISTLTGGKWFGKTLHLEVNGISSVMGIVGAFVGLYFVRNLNKETQDTFPQKNLDEIDNKFNETSQRTPASFYDKYKDQIFNLLFIALFVLCIFSPPSKYVIFILLLLFNLFLVGFSIKEKLYSTKIMKINLAKNIVMVIALIPGLVNKTAALYVSIICLTLCFFDLLRGLITQHSQKK